MLETKEKKKREEVNKFFKAIEKYYMTYLSDAPIYGLEIPPALLEDEEVKALIRKKKIVETPSHQKKDDGSYFLKLVERYRRKSCKFPCTITLQKIKEFEETTEFYEIVEIVPPRQPLDKNRELLENDPIWEIMQYKGLTPSQKFRKYKKLTHKTHKKQDDKESKAMSEHRELSEIREFSENKEMAESKELNEASETSEVHGFEPKDLQINIKDSPIFSDTESPKHKNQFESPALKKFESPKPTKPESPVSKEFDPPGLNIAESSMLKRIAPPTLMNIEPKSMMEIEIGKIVEPTIANKTEMSALNRIEPPTTSKTNEMLLEKSKGATISQIIEPPMKKTTETSMLDLIEPQNWNKIGQLGHIIGNQNESSTVFNLDEYMKVLQTGNKIEQPLFRKLESPPKIQKNESPKLKRPELTESKPSEFKLGLIKKSYLNNLIYDQNKTLPIDPFELMSRFSVVDDYDPKETLVCVCQKPYRGEIILSN